MTLQSSRWHYSATDTAKDAFGDWLPVGYDNVDLRVVGSGPVPTHDTGPERPFY